MSTLTIVGLLLAWLGFGFHAFKAQLRRNVNGRLYHVDDSFAQAVAIVGALFYAAGWPVLVPARFACKRIKASDTMTPDSVLAERAQQRERETARKLSEAHKTIADFDARLKRG